MDIGELLTPRAGMPDGLSWSTELRLVEAGFHPVSSVASTIPMVCPRCHQSVQAYQLAFFKNGTRITVQKCAACGSEWRDSPLDEWRSAPTPTPFTQNASPIEPSNAPASG
jgi:hypothetical protein